MEIFYNSATKVTLTPTAPDGRLTTYTDDKPITYYIGAVKVVTRPAQIPKYREVTAEQHAAYMAAYEAAIAAQQEEEGNEIP